MFEQAVWIGCPEDFGEICPEFMLETKLEGEVDRAVLFITAIGVYEARFNGERIGDFCLAPGCTVYGQRLQYQEYDVTGLLGRAWRMGQGSHRLTVTVGTGWHRGRISEGSREINKMPAAIIARLEILYRDGSSRSFPKSP